MTTSSTQAQHSPPSPPRLPDLLAGLSSFKPREGKGRGNTPKNSTQCVGEGGSEHQSKAVSAGGQAEVRRPPGETSLQAQAVRLGRISSADPAWSSSNRRVRCVCGLSEDTVNTSGVSPSRGTFSIINVPKSVYQRAGLIK